MTLHTTTGTRTPYLFHFEGQTVALGEPKFLHEINEILTSADVVTRPTYWDHAYFTDEAGNSTTLDGASIDGFVSPEDRHMLNSVGVDLDPAQFWAAIEKGVFNAGEWPDDGPVFVPQLPDWLANARSWEFDPVLPTDGPGSIGGWSRRRGVDGAGQPVGLFQLTAPDSFWVFGSVADLEGIRALCESLTVIHREFDQTTVYLGEDARISSIALPVGCHELLEQELFAAGVDTESLFWD